MKRPVALGLRVSTIPAVPGNAGPSSVAQAGVRAISEKPLHGSSTSASSSSQSRYFTLTSSMPKSTVPLPSKATPKPATDTGASSGAQGGESLDARPKPAPPAKPHRTRVSKQMRAKQFRRWFDGVLQEHRVQEAAGSGSAAVTDLRHHRIKKLQEEGGAAYTTADEFFDALRQAVLAHNEKLKQGSKDVLHFKGGYAVVAQPKIGAKLRLQQFKAQLHAVGLPIDNCHEITECECYSSHGLDVLTSYACNCGGVSTPKPYKKRLYEGVRHMGSCWGTISIDVGDDDSLAMYGIEGQYMEVSISH
ncbi:hypothetical protein GY45DRAFT_1376204 [Cubamyces sp. BRFM 1775]|nr:hypothetical protein GY45DRAFT_1376204 [Cubamyces sp. BRFM 1775]